MKENSNILVSVIVPVYNSKETIVACAANLVNQTLKEIEIIFVDDSSIDESFLILKQIQAMYPDKVRVFKTEVNSGPGGARNVGLDNAVGKYIGFVDSDDLADMSMYEVMYKAAEAADADVTDCGFYDENTGRAVAPFGEEFTGELDNTKRNGIIAKEGYLWTKLFLRETIESCNLRFRPNTAMEDTDFVLYFYALAKRAERVEQILCLHKKNPVSIMTAMKAEETYETCKRAMKAIFARMSALPEYEELRTGCESVLIGLYFCGIVNAEAAGKPFDARLKELYSIRKEVILGDGISSVYNNPYLINGMGEEYINMMKKIDRTYGK